MNKEIFDLRNCVIIELEYYDYIMKNYNYIKTERNKYKEVIDKAIEYIETRVDSSKAGKYELLNILKGSDNNE